MADEEIIVGTFPKNNREDVRVSLSKFKGHNLLGVRVWYKSEKDDPKPSKSGITIRVEMLPDLLELMQQAKEIALEKGLLEAEE